MTWPLRDINKWFPNRLEIGGLKLNFSYYETSLAGAIHNDPPL